MDSNTISIRRATSEAANFFARFLSASVDSPQRSRFIIGLDQALALRFENHWYLDKPTMGQAFRCIRINAHSTKVPPIETALIAAGLTYADIRLPLELTVWIDPDEVAYRFGEDEGSICTLASFKQTKPLTKQIIPHHPHHPHHPHQLRINHQRRPRQLVQIPQQRFSGFVAFPFGYAFIGHRHH